MTMLTGLVSHRRTPMHLDNFRMRCDETEKVFPTSSPDAYSRWLVGRAIFHGDAYSFSEGTTFQGQIDNMATVSLGEGRVIGIITPTSPDAPALWFSWPTSEIQVSTEGTSGLFKKRPTSITLEGATGAIALLMISKLFRTSYQANKESDFLANLGRVK